jgi:hypothetical protein
MAPTFLYLRWVEQQLAEAAETARVLSPRQILAALLQAYLGGATLAWVAQAAGVSLDDLRCWRRDPAFLKAMDDSKAQFAAFFLAALREQEFSLKALGELATEFALLEDSLRVRVRTRLYDDLRSLAGRVWSRHERRQPQEFGEFRRFVRLLAFFTALEQIWPGPLGRRLAEEFLPLAREVAGTDPGTEVPELAVGLELLGPLPREEVLAVLQPRLQKLARSAGLTH